LYSSANAEVTIVVIATNNVAIIVLTIFFITVYLFLV